MGRWRMPNLVGAMAQKPELITFKTAYASSGRSET
jgi:hypothetical protein